MTTEGMTPEKEVTRAIKAVRKAESALKSAREVCDDPENGEHQLADNIGEFQSRVQGIAVNLEQHVQMKGWSA